jgi:galactokinase
VTDWRPSLRAAGFLDEEVDRRAKAFDLVLARWRERFGPRDPTIAYHVPGRIEVLGKHTDYAGGRSLVCATEQGLAVLAAPAAGPRVRLVDARSQEQRDFEIDRAVRSLRGDWVNYPITVARRFLLDLGPLEGVDLVFASNLPYAAGVSSSSAIVVATALVLIAVNRLDARPEFTTVVRSLEELGGYLGAVENGRPFGRLAGGAGVGTMGGSQDQTAILCARPNALTQFRFDPVSLEGVTPWPADLTFAIAASGLVAEKTGAALEHYNGLARLTARLAELVDGGPRGSRGRTLGGALMEDAELAERVASRLRQWPDQAEAGRLLARLTQLTAECRTIIPGVADALRRGDRDRLGELVAASQQGAVLGLRNQVEETVGLVAMAKTEGAVAASAFGAGFGGSVWAMVERRHAESFAARWKASYLERFPARSAGAVVFLTRPGPPATRLAV